MLPHIPPEAINTPWEPQAIVWRHADEAHRAREAQAVVASGADFIVREVIVRHPAIQIRNHDLSHDDTLEALELADKEFELMESLGIVPAPTQWHAFVDHEGTTRTLARIGVIDGVPYTNKAFHAMNNAERKRVEQLGMKIGKYSQLRHPGTRLADVERRLQYLFGTIRPQEYQDLTPQASDCLIDTEPIFWLHPSLVGVKVR